MPRRTRQDQLADTFKVFHQDHPSFYALFNSLSYHLIQRGFKHYSAKAVFERIRWEKDSVNEEGESDFKVNNNYTAHYSRLWMKENPKYKGFYRLRELPSGNEDPVMMPELKPEDFPTE